MASAVRRRMVCGGWVDLLVTVACLATYTSAIVYPSPNPKETEVSYWYQLMSEEIQQALHKPKNTGKAKNVLLFLGDGMGVTVGTAGRILKGQKQGMSGEEGHLVWEKFPNIALLKTYTVDKQVPDSASTASAYLSGVKANYKTLGVTGKVKYMDCAASLLPENRLDSILKWAQDAGKDTGVVTTTQVTHATPAALYAKAANRKWQCDTIMTKDNATSCVDIARQLVLEDPGKNMKVIMGGGRQELGAPQEEAEQKCPRSDGRNLVKEWQEDKMAEGATPAYVTNTRQLRDVDPEATDFLMGLFGERHTPYEVDRDQGPDGTPTLKEMTQMALRVLKKGPNGFFLLVEGGTIDKGLHLTKPRRALEEVVSLDETVEAALEMVDLEETLVLVTADHSHTMAMAGYPPRGNDILGVTTYDKVADGLPYTTLMFTTGQGYSYTWDGEKVMRRNLTGVDTTHKDFEALAAVPTVEEEETHGGEDVAVFAIGPMSHLFHRVHEQTYVAHVMGYAACIGPYKDDCGRPADDTQGHSCSQYPHVPEHSEGGESHPTVAPEGAQTVPGKLTEDHEGIPEDFPEDVHDEQMEEEEEEEEDSTEEDDDEIDSTEAEASINTEEDGEDTNLEPVEDVEDAHGHSLVNPANAYVHVKNLEKKKQKAGAAANSATCVTVLCTIFLLGL
ncbi:alkaline phosphatase-like [Panulirus ornatus]|uniref:alkaline phosphatase-like n=1 Tax=Panulirus ornatus TaxID=150431 RepID=UPI003A8BC458